jgi:hypothetical protein
MPTAQIEGRMFARLSSHEILSNCGAFVHDFIEMEPVIHIHEDDWGMRSMHPVQAMPEVDADLQEAITAAERNRVPDGFGWTDIHQIKSPQKDYGQSGLRLADASGALQPIMSLLAGNEI